MAAIELVDISKKFSERFALKNITFQVPQGEITGFVGPNGAGKTTTIRILLGLIAPTSGSAKVFGIPTGDARRYLSKVGSMIEGPAFYPNLPGIANLKVLAEIGGIPTARAGKLLEFVGLGGRQASRFKSYSLGMKQRLGIAAALLPNPDLLILDEPTNGLDPMGIQEIRNLLLKLKGEGKTIFVSSHLLSEIESICENIVILHHGCVTYFGKTAKLLDNESQKILIKPEFPVDISRLALALRTDGISFDIVKGEIVVQAPSDFAPEINRIAFSCGITLKGLAPVTTTLEEKFFAISGATR